MQKLDTCNKFIWSQYERLRIATQRQRFAEGEEMIVKRKQKKKSFKTRIQESIEHRDELLNKKGEWDIVKLMLFHDVSRAYAYSLKRGIELQTIT